MVLSDRLESFILNTIQYIINISHKLRRKRNEDLKATSSSLSRGRMTKERMINVKKYNKYGAKVTREISMRTGFFNVLNKMGLINAKNWEKLND